MHQRNFVNRNAFWPNIEIICQSIARYFKNCYSLANQLLIIGSGKCNQWKVKLRLIQLTCQIYAIAVIPMISMLVKISLQGTCNIFTVAYADDSTAAGLIDQLTKWWNELYRVGSKYGYYQEEIKSWLVIRKTAEEHAEFICKHSNIEIIEGSRHLRD